MGRDVDDDFESRLANAIKELDDPAVRERLRLAFGGPCACHPSLGVEIIERNPGKRRRR